MLEQSDERTRQIVGSLPAGLGQEISLSDNALTILRKRCLPRSANGQSAKGMGDWLVGQGFS
jgi:hypothetical protein